MNDVFNSNRADGPNLHARMGARVAAALSERSEQLPHEISERLRAGREQALSLARQARAARAATAPAAPAQTGVVVLGGGSAAVLRGGPGRGNERTPWWLRLANVLPLALLVGGLVLVKQWQTQESALAAAEIDTQLLSDQVPPTAYADPGFLEFLKLPAAAP